MHMFITVIMSKVTTFPNSGLKCKKYINIHKFTCLN